MTKRVSFKDVLKHFENKGLKLLETEYKDVKYPMKFYCSAHDYYGTVKWTDFKQNKGGCFKCNKVNFNNFSYEYVKSEIEKRGFQLISKEYINTKKKLEIYCKKHKNFFVTFGAFKVSEFGCKKCAAEHQGNIQRSSIDEIRKEFLIGGYILEDDAEYINWDTKLPCYCIKHPDKLIHTTRQNAKTGKGCIECKREKLSGENSHLWKGGVTTGNRAFRTSYEYKQWRKSVYERDSYTCQCCGKSGGRLNVHHINNFSDNEELRLDIYNGITLCVECHAFKYGGSFHSLYGTYNNNLHQLQNYIDDFRDEVGLPPINIIEDIIYKDYIFDIDKNS